MTGLTFFRALNFLVIEDFFDGGERSRIRAAMTASPSEAATVYRDRPDVTDESIRRTRAVTVPREVRSAVTEKLDGSRSRAASHFKASLTKLEGPQFLLYRPGDFFTRHTDWNDANGRQVSFIAFLNSDFDGGALKFYGGVEEKVLELTLPVSDGMLVFFRSDWFHEVEPVTRGERFTIVGWFA